MRLKQCKTILAQAEAKFYSRAARTRLPRARTRLRQAIVRTSPAAPSLRTSPAPRLLAPTTPPRLWDIEKGTCLEAFAHLPNSESASWVSAPRDPPDPRDQGGKFLHTSPGAWRWLRWRARFRDDSMRLLPGELSGDWETREADGKRHPPGPGLPASSSTVKKHAPGAWAARLRRSPSSTTIRRDY